MKASNAILPDWLQTILDVVGDFGIAYACLKWAYRKRSQLKKLSSLAYLGTMLGLLLVIPHTIVPVNSINPPPIGRFTSNVPSYVSSSQNSSFDVWSLFLGAAVLAAVTTAIDVLPLVRPFLKRMFSKGKNAIS